MGILETIKMFEREEGREEGKLATAKKMKILGIDLDTIIAVTGFSFAKIESL